MKCQILFSKKNKNNIISLSSAVFTQSVAKINCLLVFSYVFRHFWEGVECLVNSTIEPMFQDQCLGRVKQLIHIHPDLIIERVRNALDQPVYFPADPILCPGTVSKYYNCRSRWLSWMRRPTGDQEVAGSTPAKVSNILSWRLS